MPNNNMQTVTIASIYEERDHLLTAGADFEPGMISGKIDDVTALAKDLIKQGKWTIGTGMVPVSTVERVLSDLRYDLIGWKGTVGLFLSGFVSIASDDDSGVVVISLGRQVKDERPVLVILGCENGIYNLLDLDSAKTMKASSIQVAARVIAAGVEYL